MSSQYLFRKFFLLHLEANCLNLLTVLLLLYYTVFSGVAENIR